MVSKDSEMPMRWSSVNASISSHCEYLCMLESQGKLRRHLSRIRAESHPPAMCANLYFSKSYGEVNWASRLR